MGLADIIIVSFILLAMVGVTLVYTKRDSQLSPYKPIILLGAMLWFVYGLFHVELTESLFSIKQADAVRHVRVGKELAFSMEYGQWGDVWRHAQKLGNKAFQAYLGVFYYITSTGGISTALVNVFLAFWGSLALVHMIICMTAPSCIPGLRLMLLIFMPSLVFWTTANIKEGIMFWCICNIFVASNPHRKKKGIAVIVLAIISIIVGAILRPHVILIWLAAIFGILMWRRGGKIWAVLLMFMTYPILLVLDQMTGFGMSVDGALDVMNRNAYHIQKITTSSGISSSATGSVMLFSGFAVLFLRPYPWEVISFAQMVTAIETWVVFLTIIFLWIKLGPKLRRKARQMLIVRISILVCLLFCVLFSRLSNIGLVARQRLQLLPAVIVLIAVPWLLLRQPKKDIQ